MTYGIGWAYGNVSWGTVEFAGIEVESQAFMDVTAASNPALSYGANGIIGLGFDSLSTIDALVNHSGSATGRTFLYNAFQQNKSEPNFISFTLEDDADPDDSIQGYLLARARAGPRALHSPLPFQSSSQDTSRALPPPTRTSMKAPSAAAFQSPLCSNVSSTDRHTSRDVKATVRPRASMSSNCPAHMLTTTDTGQARSVVNTPRTSRDRHCRGRPDSPPLTRDIRTERCGGPPSRPATLTGPEGRDWAPTKKIAIHAATDTLQNQIVVPRMSDVPPSLTLDATDQPLSSSLLSISRKSTSLSSQECDQSLVQDSFHSAVSSIDWHYLSPNSAAFLDSRGIHEMHTFQSSPGTSPLDTAARRKVPFLGVSGWAQASLMVVQPSTESEASTLVVHGMHKKFYTAPESGTKLQEHIAGH
ncbi:hypothetical protein POSPLADRAFT_1058599 [Postia placenta MAD-698-R-SB12]|uniref:Peptidase A1 domain-containing protein n=1 Tax=Postia placenta MAD-698-R-SB12 TaxID=670580 RepID=A0A1X6MW36_9APHY|nr:hypothetical protein POSPLADRAFT_1058599 [Postia placenta MAD-698-R-SB12]OSX60436.1 hypothetical protein POSPLADRAFT_1058599 [Postia placenta MAD-698-R-SB12]